MGGECALSPSRQTEAHIYVASGGGGLSSFLQLMSADAVDRRRRVRAPGQGGGQGEHSSSALHEEKVDIRHEGEGEEGAEMGGKFKVARCTKRMDFS